MRKISDVREKEIINIYDGKRLGYVNDVEINMETGMIEAIVVPSPNRIKGLFSKAGDTVIPWPEIVRFGEDVILIDKPT